MNDILSENIVYQGRILKMTHDEVTFEDGSRGYRDVLHLPGAVAILAFDENGRILMVSQYRHAVEDEVLELPAGMLEKGEDPLVAAKRELQEETGYACGKIVHMTDFYTSPGVVKETLHLYLAGDLHYVHQNLDDDEFLRVRTVSRQEFEQMIFDNRIKDAKTIIAYLFWKNYLKENG
ncbi:MAG: NUDIX hydrolase [Erysipelotrichaceae bacterium]|nr:NUDIX hydrolase [Erysipelotrichaceae bacterium]